MSTPKTCPIMSGMIPGHTYPDGSGEPPHFREVPCQGSDCQWWIQPYTTESRLGPQGCAVELFPQMIDGLFRV